MNTPDKSFRHKSVVERFPYAPRANYQGWIIWSCARCARIQRTYLRHGAYLIRCTGAYCKQKYVLGLTFYANFGGTARNHLGPRPYDHVFPACELKEWGVRYKKVHELVADEIAEEESGNSGLG